MSCNSASTIVADLWNKYGETATKILGAGASIAMANPAGVVSALAKAKKIAEATEKAVAFWNKMAGNSWAKIGPRQIKLGEKVQGTLQSIGDRTFVTSSPFTCDKVRVSIAENDGKGKVEVTGCLFTGGSRKEEKINFTWNNTSSEKKDKSQYYSKEFSGVKGKYLSILLDGKSVTRSFQYSIKVSKA